MQKNPGRGNELEIKRRIKENKTHGCNNNFGRPQHPVRAGLLDADCCYRQYEPQDLLSQHLWDSICRAAVAGAAADQKVQLLRAHKKLIEASHE